MAAFVFTRQVSNSEHGCFEAKGKLRVVQLLLPRQRGFAHVSAELAPC